MKIPFVDYLHGSKEDMCYTLEEVYKKAGLEAPDGELDMYAYEISIQCVLDTDTNQVEIVGCEGYLIDRTKKLELVKE